MSAIVTATVPASIRVVRVADAGYDIRWAANDALIASVVGPSLPEARRRCEQVLQGLLLVERYRMGGGADKLEVAAKAAALTVIRRIEEAEAKK